MRRWPKQKRFWYEEDGRRYKERRKMSPAWLRRARRYLEAAGMRSGGILFVRSNVTEEMALLGRASRSTPVPALGAWCRRTPPRRRVRGQWREVRS